MSKVFKGLINKIKESFFVVLPITAIIFAVICFLVPTSSSEKINLLICFVLLVVGTTLFTNGADMSMIGIGESVGGGLCRTKKLWLMLLVSFLIGFITTLAEPDLQVFASQAVQSFAGISNLWAPVIIASFGVAVFFVLCVVKTIFKLSMPVILALSYGLIFIISIFLPDQFIGLAFDAGGVTTGPISVPFFIAFGLGVSSVRWRNRSDDDNFGMIALCSVGPVIAMMIFCLFVKDPSVISSSTASALSFGGYFLKYMKEIFIVIAPILAIFIIFQFTMIKFPKKQIIKTLLGIVYTYIGIVLFLVGVNVGYLPLASSIGEFLAEKNWQVLIYVLGAILGFCCVVAEPALQVLKKQVSDITHGAVKEGTITIFMALGVSVSVILAIVKTIFSINIIWFILPIFTLSLILGFINTRLFTAIAFDGGGVATGALSVSFILPLINGIAKVVGGSTAFGTIALISSMPILSLQILGLIYKIKLSKHKFKNAVKSKDATIINFNWEEE